MTELAGGKWDAIVVGAGHNGLVCAALLAQAGKSVLVLEAEQQVGGAAVTRELTEGFSVSPCAHLLYQLQPEVCKELKVSPTLACEDLATIALSRQGNHVRIAGNAVTGVTGADAEQFRRFRKRSLRFARLLRGVLNRAPPRLGTSDWRDVLSLARMGFDIRRLGRDEMREFLRIIGMNIHDEVTERFANPLLRGAICLDAVLGTHLGPRSPNTMFTYLYRLAGDGGRNAVPRGGMGMVSAVLAQAARSAGAEIMTATPVRQIVVENGRVTGVETEAGELFSSYTVISNADPKRTVMRLVGARHFETGFIKRVHHLRSHGNAAKLHLALDGLPHVDGLAFKDFGERLLIAGDEHYVERAFNPAKYFEFSTAPVIEVTFPSIHDESLAPPGKHVMSAVVQYAPFALKDGWTEASRQRFLDIAMTTIAEYLPGLEQQVIASELLTPADIETQFHINGGHWHHGELALDQFLFVRPVSGAAQYALPLDGLFLCGAGAHPGGGVSGAPGRNAARTILKRERVR
ncbi:MAG: NAD(P)/FAD-dependent oxidoreductase [Woeseiaceae bacterium]